MRGASNREKRRRERALAVSSRCALVADKRAAFYSPQDQHNPVGSQDLVYIAREQRKKRNDNQDETAFFGNVSG